MLAQKILALNLLKFYKFSPVAWRATITLLLVGLVQGRLTAHDPRYRNFH